MTDSKHIGDAPSADQRITEMHCWITVYGNGSEGICAGGIEGFGMMTLMSSKRDVAEQLEGAAQTAMRSGIAVGHDIKSVRLVTFRRIENG